MADNSDFLPLGTFVMVGDSVGVIVGWPDGNQIPEDHYAVWYGQTVNDDVARPLCRTVPTEYCRRVASIDYYH